jgi:hypothetical protein
MLYVFNELSVLCIDIYSYSSGIISAVKLEMLRELHSVINFCDCIDKVINIQNEASTQQFWALISEFLRVLGLHIIESIRSAHH